MENLKFGIDQRNTHPRLYFPVIEGYRSYRWLSTLRIQTRNYFKKQSRMADSNFRLCEKIESGREFESFIFLRNSISRRGERRENCVCCSTETQNGANKRREGARRASDRAIWPHNVRTPPIALIISPPFTRLFPPQICPSAREKCFLLAVWGRMDAS